MFTPLLPIVIDSIYGYAPLPTRLARCTPDMYTALMAVKQDVAATGGRLLLSDLFRSYDMQLQAHQDYVSGKKRAFSPAPGGSMHEAGRAFDLDLDAIKRLTLAKFWTIAERHGLSPIVDRPDPNLSEAWHFDCRGSHALIYDYYKAGKATNFKSPYTAMAASAIVSAGQSVDALGSDVRPAYIQSGLIRLGHEVGNLDGRIGPKTREALEAVGVDPLQPVDEIAAAIDRKLQQMFPDEFFVRGTLVEPDDIPLHLAETMAPAVVPSLSAIAYRPHPASRPILGAIVDLLPQATPIEKNFVHPPKMLARLPGGQLYFDSNLELDTDGAPVGNNGDPNWQSQTSLRYADDSSLDANAIPFFVLPLPTSWSQQLGISLGDYAAVIYKNFLCYAIFADLGPKNKLGEGSIELLRQLGQERVKNGRIVNSGMGPGIITIVFPGSGVKSHRANSATLQAAIGATTAPLFAALGGSADAANLVLSQNNRVA